MKKMYWTDPETEEVLVNSESVLEGSPLDNLGGYDGEYPGNDEDILADDQ